MSEMKKDREYDYHKYWKDLYETEKKKRQEAENETILIKGITINNSPEMRVAQEKIKELEIQSNKISCFAFKSSFANNNNNFGINSFASCNTNLVGDISNYFWSVPFSSILYS